MILSSVIYSSEFIYIYFTSVFFGEVFVNIFELFAFLWLSFKFSAYFGYKFLNICKYFIYHIIYTIFVFIFIIYYKNNTHTPTTSQFPGMQ